MGTAARGPSALDSVDATDNQRASVDGVLDTAVPKLYALHEEGAALREEGAALFTAETIDAAAVEGLRQDALSARRAPTSPTR